MFYHVLSCFIMFHPNVAGRFSLDETNESSTGSPISSGPSSTCWIPASSKFEAGTILRTKQPNFG